GEPRAGACLPPRCAGGGRPRQRRTRHPCQVPPGLLRRVRVRSRRPQRRGGMPQAGMKTLLVVAALMPALILAEACEAQDRPTIIGAAIRSRPAYDGSSSEVTDIIPQLRYYGSLWFARTTQGVLEGGVRNELAPEFWAGAQIAYEAGRNKSESPFLEARNEPDIKPGASVGLHLEWDRRLGQVPIGFLIRARQHLDSDLGGQADLRINVGIFSRFGLEGAVFGQAT